MFDRLILHLRCMSAAWCCLVVPITAEPEHRIRFDNGTVRMYEVRLPKGHATLMHEHRADSFSVIFGDTEITNEPLEGAATESTFAAGRVGFASTAQGIDCISHPL